MRRGRRGTEDSIDALEDKPEPEFARVKLKKAGSVARSIDEKPQEEGSSNELRIKLQKQKSAADGISGSKIKLLEGFYLVIINPKET